MWTSNHSKYLIAFMCMKFTFVTNDRTEMEARYSIAFSKGNNMLYFIDIRLGA